MDDLLRLIAVVRRDLDATNVRIELGGEPTDDGHHVHVDLSPGWRLVAVFTTPPEDADETRTRMRAMFETFHDAARLPSRDGPSPGMVPGPEGQRARIGAELGDVLGGLQDRADSEMTLIIDDRSPVVWGSASSWPFLDIDEAVRFVALLGEHAGDSLIDRLVAPDAETPERPRLSLTGSSSRTIEALREREPARSREDWARAARSARAVALVREHVAEEASHGARLTVQRDDLGVWAHSFAGIYWLLHVFPGRFNELGAEGPSMRALPVVERLVLSIPPIDPEPKGGRLFAFLRSVD